LFNVVRGELMDIEALERAIEEDDERIKAKEAE
jgi:phosphoglycerate dehydrogenase-like enzyme